MAEQFATDHNFLLLLVFSTSICIYLIASEPMTDLTFSIDNKKDAVSLCMILGAQRGVD